MHEKSTSWYAMFCVIMFTYAFELLLWPFICLNQIGYAITSETTNSRLFGYVFNRERRHKNTAACLGGCFKFLQCLSCNKLGGGKIRAQADLKDAAVAFMDFFNDKDANFDIVLSDVWLCFKMLHRIHKERRHKLSQQARMDKISKGEGQIIAPQQHAANYDIEDAHGSDSINGEIVFSFVRLKQLRVLSIS